MAQERPNRLTEWAHLLRDQLPVAREQVRKWLTAVRQEPGLVWNTAATRYAILGFGAVVILWVMYGLAGLLAPSQEGARPAAITADFHVVCSDYQCRHHFAIHREFGFHKFPVVCPKCQQATGREARICNSQMCRGRWVAPQEDDGRLYCPECSGGFD